MVWNARSDALSSVVVLVGVGGAMAGMPWLDLVAAIVVAIMLGKIGWEFAWRSVLELVDSALAGESSAGYSPMYSVRTGCVRCAHFA